MRRKGLRRNLPSFEKNKSLNSFSLFSKDSLDIIFKIPLAIAGFFYVSGVIVQGLHFGRFGISSLNLFKLSYILAGFWAVLAIVPQAFVITFLFVVLFKPNIFLSHLKSKNLFISKILIRIGAILTIVGAYGVIQSIFPFLIKSYSNFFQMFLMGGMLCFAAFITFSLITEVIIKVSDNKAKILLFLFCQLFFVVFYCSCLYIFSKSIYLNIPIHLGGGQPSAVNLIFKASEKQLSLLEQETQIQFERNIQSNQNKTTEDDTSYSAKVLLIIETDEGLYFKVENNRVIFLPRDSILNVVYSENTY
jgi:hypothetical protein